MDKKTTLAPIFISGLLAASFFTQAAPVDETTEQTEQQSTTIEQLDPYQGFVTEKLYIFIHSGSSTRYRIIGRAAAGEKLTVVAKDKETGWLKIEQANGKTGWIEESVLINHSGSKGKLEQAQKQIEQLQAKVASLSNNEAEKTISQLNAEVGELTLANDDLARQVQQLTEQNSQIALLEAKNKELQESIVQTDQTQKILDKLYDVGAVLLGVFAGWILTRRRKSSLSFDRL